MVEKKSTKNIKDITLLEGEVSLRSKHKIALFINKMHAVKMKHITLKGKRSIFQKQTQNCIFFFGKEESSIRHHVQFLISLSCHIN